MDRPFRHPVFQKVKSSKMRVKLTVRVNPTAEGALDLFDIFILVVNPREL